MVARWTPASSVERTAAPPRAVVRRRAARCGRECHPRRVRSRRVEDVRDRRVELARVDVRVGCDGAIGVDDRGVQGALERARAALERAPGRVRRAQQRRQRDRLRRRDRVRSLSRRRCVAGRDAGDLAPERDQVQIALEDLRLRPGALERPRPAHLPELVDQAAARAGRRAGRVEERRELHRDRAAAAPAPPEDEVARATASARKSTPPWRRKRRSSAARTARTSAGEIASSGVHSSLRRRGSIRCSCRISPWRSSSATSEGR
jgi:hypothetical protein